MNGYEDFLFNSKVDEAWVISTACPEHKHLEGRRFERTAGEIQPCRAGCIYRRWETSTPIFAFQPQGGHPMSVLEAINMEGKATALGFTVGDVVRVGTMLPRADVGELFNALGAWLSDGGLAVEIEPRERMAIFGEVHLERRAQDAQWGGAQHDEEHDAADWSRFMQQQAGKGFAEAHRQLGPKWRARFVKIAALAVAAVESIDRQTKVG
jgi:hypothetical protein